MCPCRCKITCRRTTRRSALCRNALIQLFAVSLCHPSHPGFSERSSHLFGSAAFPDPTQATRRAKSKRWQTPQCEASRTCLRHALSCCDCARSCLLPQHRQAWTALSTALVLKLAWHTAQLATLLGCRRDARRTSRGRQNQERC